MGASLATITQVDVYSHINHKSAGFILTNSTAADLIPHAHDEHEQQVNAGMPHMCIRAFVFFTLHMAIFSFLVQLHGAVWLLINQSKMMSLFFFLNTKLSTKLRFIIASRSRVVLLSVSQIFKLNWGTNIAS